MADIKRISPQEAAEKLADGYVYVDVRTVEEFTQGHPAGASNVPVMMSGGGGMVPNPDFAKVMAASFPRDAKLVLGCKAGGRSLRAAQLLAAEGYTDVVDQRAGWDGSRNEFGQVTEPGWSRVGLPIEGGSPPGRSYADQRRKL